MPDYELPPDWSPRNVAALRRALLKWFDGNQRNLPWRHNRDPYRIWVSEVMLQQTTVAAVIPYYERFLSAFPNVQSLAEADERSVLKLWEGLGYYRRAKHLLLAARELAKFGNDLPNDPAVWAALPGVGRYILGAVLSQAFDNRLPIVEANSLRVLSRWFGYRGDPRVGDGKKWVWSAAEQVLPNTRVGDFNQAVMELGQTICTPVSPSCHRCPVAKWCSAKRLGIVEQIPPPVKPSTKIEVREVAVIICKRGRVLLVRRPADASRWANLWEAPHGEMQSEETVDDAAIRIAEELTGITVKSGTEVLLVRHTVTRWTITMTGMGAQFVKGTFRSGVYAEAVWLNPADLVHYPMSTPQRRLFREFVRKGKQTRLC